LIEARPLRGEVPEKLARANFFWWQGNKPRAFAVVDKVGMTAESVAR